MHIRGSSCIVKYNGILARRQLRQQEQAQKRVPKPTLRRGGDPDNHRSKVPKKPACIKRLLEEGRPLGTKFMYPGPFAASLGYQPSMKYNVHDPGNIAYIAQWLLHTTQEERAEILEKMVMNCTPCQAHKIWIELRCLIDDVVARSNYCIAKGLPLICDTRGILR